MATRRLTNKKRKVLLDNVVNDHTLTPEQVTRIRYAVHRLPENAALPAGRIPFEQMLLMRIVADGEIVRSALANYGL